MPTLEIEEWEWDDTNLNELGKHGLSRSTVIQTATEAPKFRSNKKGRAATHQMIGPDYGGTHRTVCIVQNVTYVGRWRAITGWKSELHEIDWYNKTERGS